MRLELTAFTRRGTALAARLAEELTRRGHQAACTRSAGESAAEWSAQAFGRAQGLIFVGAAGIAVRSIAPHLRHKSTDPAVVVVDEGGQFAIPILSGHLGGANDLAREIAALHGTARRSSPPPPTCAGCFRCGPVGPPPGAGRCATRRSIVNGVLRPAGGAGRLPLVPVAHRRGDRPAGLTGCGAGSRADVVVDWRSRRGADRPLAVPQHPPGGGGLPAGDTAADTYPRTAGRRD